MTPARRSGDASRERGRAATIYDVARRAGVSHQTVSRLLTGFEGIRPQTRERVEAAIVELEYRPNLVARSLKTGKSHRIGALTHAIDQIGPNQLLRGAAAAARQSGYVLDIITFGVPDPGTIAQSLSVVTQEDLAGILVLASTDEMIAALQDVDFHVPVHISIDGSERPAGAAELELIVDHLYRLGHRRFFHIAGSKDSPAGRHRTAGYEGALVRRGLESAGTHWGDWSSRSGFAAVAEVPSDVTAVVCANDQMALGALLALQERGLRVPHDVSVTGIDDIPESAYFTPPLTTVHVDFERDGAFAITALLEEIGAGEAVQGPSERLFWLVERTSTSLVRPTP